MKSSSPARALSWEIARQHRWGFIAIGSYLLVLATIRLVLLASGQPLDVKHGIPFAFSVLVPSTAAVFYVIGVFSFGFTGDLSARQSMYPARLLALPVSTALLSDLPMAAGTAAGVGLWLATRLIAVFPGDWNVPVIWPALFVAAFLAWTQVLTWMPYGWQGVRAVFAVSLLMLADTAAIVAIHYQVPELLASIVLAPLIAFAFVAARVAVARARRGEIPDWTFIRLQARANSQSRTRRHFASAHRAQLWFEWRSSGRSLPTLVAIVVPFELALLFAPGNDTPAFLFVVLVAVLLTPLVMASVAAATIRTPNPHGGDVYGLTAFMATRPLTSAALVAAKLKMAMWSTMVTWLLVLVAIPPALVLSGTRSIAIDELDRAISTIGQPRVIVLSVFGFSALFASTWKRLVQSLCIGLTGRGWLVKSSVFLTLSIVIVIPPAADWLHRSADARIAVWNALPWIPAVLVALKMSAAAWIAVRLYRTRVLSDRTLVAGACGWMVMVLALYALLAWLAASPHIPHYWLVLVAILFVPLPRLAAAPLALAWNRHRGQVVNCHGQFTANSRPDPRYRVLVAVLVLINLPVALAGIEAVSFYVVNRNTGTIVSSGETRAYRLHVPKSYDPAKAAPLVISMHGAGLWPAAQMEISQWNRTADEQGLIVVYPSGLSGRGPAIWRADGGPDLEKDVRFISALIDTIRAAYNIDPARIYADGLSNGGGMAFVLSCTLSDRIAAVGIVASAQLLPFRWCTDKRPVPVIGFHGTADPVTPYGGGTTWVSPQRFPDIPSWMANWARRNRCATTAVESAIASDVIRRAYPDCADHADVVLYTIIGGGHTWPGGGPLPEFWLGPVNRSVSASDLMWAFYREHPLAPR